MRWTEQGIWNCKWKQFAFGRWKHEEPLEPESELETDSKAGPSLSFSFSPNSQPKLRRPKSDNAKSDNEKRRIAEQQVIREREREASRPYHQFLYQMSKERERIQEESENGEGADAADINTKAYENVKNIWTKRRIWNEKWGTMPGMSWKHEGPFEEEDADGLASVPANSLVNGRHEAGEAPAIPIFGSPSPGKSDHRQASGALKSSSQRGPPADIDPVELDNGGAERSSSTSNSPSLGSGEKALRSETGRALLKSKRRVYREDGKPANTFLGPVHSSKVLKVAGKRRGPQERLNISQMLLSNGLPISSAVNAAELQPSPLPGRVAPRGSKRIRPPVPTLSKDPVKTASTNHSKRAVLKRNVESCLTAKSPYHGIVKKQPATITRRKKN